MFEANRPQVNLRGVDARMPEDARQPEYVETVLRGMNGVGMAECVGMKNGDTRCSTQPPQLRVDVVPLQGCATECGEYVAPTRLPQEPEQVFPQLQIGRASCR